MSLPRTAAEGNKLLIAMIKQGNLSKDEATLLLDWIVWDDGKELIDHLKRDLLQRRNGIL